MYGTHTLKKKNVSLSILLSGLSVALSRAIHHNLTFTFINNFLTLDFINTSSLRK